MSSKDKNTKPKLTQAERKAKYPPKQSDKNDTTEQKTTMSRKTMAKLGDDNYTQDQVDNRPRDQSNPIMTHKKSTIWVDGKEIDPWAIDPVTPENPLNAPIEESSFATLFPKYREQYLREVWSLVSSTLTSFGIQSELNLVEGSMTVKTTRKMIDPYMIIKARDVIKLLARSFPVQQALKVLQDGVYCDVIKIKGMVQNKETFVKRRSRLIGPNGATLKAIELLTDCYILVQGTTVAVMGPFKQLDVVKQIVEDTMHNIHPVYRIKQMMIERELAKNESLQNDDWNRYIPKITKKNVKSYKREYRQKGEYTPFPTQQLPRKVDLEMESGAFWLKKPSSDDKDYKKAPKADIFGNSNATKRKFTPSNDDASTPVVSKKQKVVNTGPTEIVAGINVAALKSKVKK